MGEWISVKDRLPDSSGWHIVYLDGRVISVPYNNARKEFTGALGEGLHKVSHWMPYPDPPTDKPGVLKTIYETPEFCEDCYAHLSLEWSFCPECGHITPWADGESMMNQ